MKLGNFTIHYLPGGNTYIDGGDMFGVVLKSLWTKKYEVNAKNQIHTPTHPILIQIGDSNILIDAGIGNEKLSDKQCRNYGVEYESLMNEDLQDLGLTTTDIDMVLMTHLHHDHACGLTDKEGNAIFSQATHFIQQDEWHEFLSPNIRSQATY